MVRVRVRVYMCNRSPVLEKTTDPKRRRHIVSKDGERRRREDSNKNSHNHQDLEGSMGERERETREREGIRGEKGAARRRQADRIEVTRDGEARARATREGGAARGA